MTPDQNEAAERLLELLKGSDRFRQTATGAEFLTDSGQWVSLENASTEISEQIVRLRRTRPKDKKMAIGFLVFRVKRYRYRQVVNPPGTIVPPRPAVYCYIWANDPLGTYPVGLSNSEPTPYVRYGFSTLKLADRAFDVPPPTGRYDDFSDGRKPACTYTKYSGPDYITNIPCICAYVQDGATLPALPSSVSELFVGSTNPPSWRLIDQILVLPASGGGGGETYSYVLDEKQELYAYTRKGVAVKVKESEWYQANVGSPGWGSPLPSTIGSRFYLEFYRFTQESEFYRISANGTPTEIESSVSWRSPLYSDDPFTNQCAENYANNPFFNFNNGLSKLFTLNASDFPNQLAEGKRLVGTVSTIKTVGTETTCTLTNSSEKQKISFPPLRLDQFELGAVTHPEGGATIADTVDLVGSAFIII